MPSLNNMQESRWSKTVVEPPFYLVLLSLPHLLSSLICSKVRNWPLQLGAAEE